MNLRERRREKVALRPSTSGQSSIPDTAPPALNLGAHALFLDLDGTLAPIVERPDMVCIGEDLRALLARLAGAMDGAVALITGRTIADADRILGGAIENVAGEHGFEVRRAAHILNSHIDLHSIAAARAEAQALIKAEAPTCTLEDKTASVAFHFRQAPEIETTVRQLAETLARKHGLRTLEGKMVIELVAGAHSKANALNAYLKEPPFKGRAPIAVGDDVTDEDAFRAAAAHGGFAVLVGERRQSDACYWLANPDAVGAWLKSSLEGAP